MCVWCVVYVLLIDDAFHFRMIDTMFSTSLTHITYALKLGNAE